jgi:hypothetical protein
VSIIRKVEDIFKPATKKGIASRREEHYGGKPIEVEFAVPVGDMMKSAVASDTSDMDNWDMLDSPSTLEYIRDYWALPIIQDEGAKVDIQGIVFQETDSGNISHANAIYRGFLVGSGKEIMKVASEEGDKTFFIIGE